MVRGIGVTKLRSRPASFGSGGNQHDKRIARLTGAHLHLDVFEGGAPKKALELGVRKSQALIAKPPSHPSLLVLPEIEDQKPAPWPQNPDGFGDRLFGIRRVMQGLGEQGDINRGVAQWQTGEFALLPLHIRDASPVSKRLRTFEHKV